MIKEMLFVGDKYLVDTEPKTDQPQKWEKMTYRYEVKNQHGLYFVFERNNGTLYATQLVALDGKTELVKEIK